MTFPVHLILMDRNGGLKKSVVWLSTTREIVVPYDEKAYPYFILNAYRSTPARVMYPTEMWEKFLSASQMIPFKIRAVLLNDAFYFYASGQLDYNVMFLFLRWLKDEKRVHLWIAMEPVIMEMNRRWLFTELHSRLVLIVKDSIREFYLGRMEHNSSLAVKFACWAQLPECLKNSELILREFIAGPNVDVPMHLDSILCAGMRRIPSSVYKHMIELSKRVWMKRDVLLMAMCCTEREYDIELLLRSLFTRDEFTITTDTKYLLLLNTFMSSSTGAEVAWRFIDQRHELLFRLFGRVRFQELAQFLSEYVKRKSQYRSLRLIFEKFDLRPGTVFETITQNRMNIHRDLRDKYKYLTEVILGKSNL